jgi:hypothetical protein
LKDKVQLNDRLLPLKYEVPQGSVSDPIYINNLHKNTQNPNATLFAVDDEKFITKDILVNSR